MREFRRALPAVLAASALAFAPAPGAAAPGDLKSLVLRGRVLDAGGRPLADARVQARGTLMVTAVTDAHGRYTLMLSMGTPAALARDPFALEVRAESGGRRIGYAGAEALRLDLSLVRGARWGVARVACNDEELTRVVAAAFGQEGPVTVTYEGVFGGTRTGATRMHTDEAELMGVPSPDGRGSGAAPADRDPDRAAEAAARAARAEAQAAARAAARARQDSVAAVRREKQRADSVAYAEQRRRRAVELDEAKRRDQARRDSVAAVRREKRRADSLAWAERHARPAPSRTPARDVLPPGTIIAVIDSVPVESPAAAAPGPAGGRVVGRPASQPPTLSDPRIVSIRPEDGPPALPPAVRVDTCVCRLRGTVEIAWQGRPRAERIPVRVTMSGPASQTQELEMFMGAPREFMLGPLPCGDYTLEVVAGGRTRFTQAPIGRPVGIRCHGWSEARLVLEPSRR